MSVRKSLLVVEDNFLIAAELATALLRHGYEIVGTATTMETATDLVSRARYDAVLLDVDLGGAATTAIAEALNGRGVPFVVVTGSGREKLPPAFQAAPYIPKPYSVRILVDALDLIGKTSIRTN